MVMLLTCIFKVIGLNLAWDANCFDVFHSFLRYSKQIQGYCTKNEAAVTSMSFEIHYSLSATHLALYSVCRFGGSHCSD
jgi:hypothetical protein